MPIGLEARRARIMEMNMCRLSIVSLALVLFSATAIAEDAPADCKPFKSVYEGKTFYLQHNLYHEDGEATWMNFMKSGDFLGLHHGAEAIIG